MSAKEVMHRGHGSGSRKTAPNRNARRFGDRHGDPRASLLTGVPRYQAADRFRCLLAKADDFPERIRVKRPRVLPGTVAILVGTLQCHGVERLLLAADRHLAGPDACRAIVEPDDCSRLSFRILRRLLRCRGSLRRSLALFVRFHTKQGEMHGNTVRIPPDRSNSMKNKRPVAWSWIEVRGNDPDVFTASTSGRSADLPPCRPQRSGRLSRLPPRRASLPGARRFRSMS